MTGLSDQIARLQGEGRLRVWSLAVTIFGDAIAPRGGSVAMSDLSTLLERLGAESGAIRTAMSRLARDGWVTRTKAGRRSYYALSAAGLASTRTASPRIYAQEPPAWDGTWTIAAGPGADAAEDAGFHRIAPATWLRAGAGRSLPADVFTVTGTGPTPDWLRDALSPPDLAARYGAITKAWQHFDAAALPTPADAMAARTLLIHDWRRVLLRDAPLPRALRPEGWPGAPARDLVAGLYRALTPASEQWLDGCEAAPGRKMPGPDGRFAARFGGMERAEA